MAETEKHSSDDDHGHSYKAVGETVNPVSDGELDIDLEAWGEEHGYVLDVEVLKSITPNWQKYQLASDGRTVLIPQPSVSVSKSPRKSSTDHLCSV
jgi:hypothetical protein